MRQASRCGGELVDWENRENEGLEMVGKEGGGSVGMVKLGY